MSEDYSNELQKLYIEFLLADKDLFVRCNAILESSYFDRQFRDTVDFIKKHVEEYQDVPMLEQVNAVASVGVTDVKATMTDEHKNWFMDEIEKNFKIDIDLVETAHQKISSFKSDQAFNLEVINLK